MGCHVTASYYWERKYHFWDNPRGEMIGDCSAESGSSVGSGDPGTPPSQHRPSYDPTVRCGSNSALGERIRGLRTGLSNGPSEAINGKIRTITGRTYGLHSASSLIALLYLCCCGLHLFPPLLARLRFVKVQESPRFRISKKSSLPSRPTLLGLTTTFDNNSTDLRQCNYDKYRHAGPPDQERTAWVTELLSPRRSPWALT